MLRINVLILLYCCKYNVGPCCSCLDCRNTCLYIHHSLPPPTGPCMSVQTCPLILTVLKSWKGQCAYLAFSSNLHVKRMVYVTWWTTQKHVSKQRNMSREWKLCLLSMLLIQKLSTGGVPLVKMLSACSWSGLEPFKPACEMQKQMCINE